MKLIKLLSSSVILLSLCSYAQMPSLSDNLSEDTIKVIEDVMSMRGSDSEYSTVYENNEPMWYLLLGWNEYKLYRYDKKEYEAERSSAIGLGLLMSKLGKAEYSNKGELTSESMDMDLLITLLYHQRYSCDNVNNKSTNELNALWVLYSQKKQKHGESISSEYGFLLDFIKYKEAYKSSDRYEICTDLMLKIRKKVSTDALYCNDMTFSMWNGLILSLNKKIFYDREGNPSDDYRTFEVLLGTLYNHETGKGINSEEEYSSCNFLFNAFGAEKKRSGERTFTFLWIPFSFD